MFQSRVHELQDFLDVSYCPLSVGEKSCVYELLHSLDYYVSVCVNVLNHDREK